MTKKKTITGEKTERPIDRYLSAFSSHHQHQINRLLQVVMVPLLTFAWAGLIWFLPFPHLSFIGPYQGYFNWFTIFMAIVIYFCLKLSPTLSYAMLFTFGFSSYLNVQLEYWEKAGGPAPWIICAAIGLIGMLGQLIGYRFEKQPLSLKAYLLFLLVGPLWLWSRFFKRVRIPY